MSWLDIIFPKKCVNCGRWGKYVCESCEVGLWEEEQICPACGRASRYGLRHQYCQRPYSLDGLTCLWAYEGVTRKLIAKAKYRFYFDYLREFSIFNFQFSNRQEFRYFLKFLETKPVIVPVPLHPKREKWRGFNQAEVIGRWLAETENLELENLLVRVKDTGQQVGKLRRERLENVKDAFQLRAESYLPASPAGRPRAVLLVDDVWTSGATMAECCRVLKKAGVKYVWGFVLAR